MNLIFKQAAIGDVQLISELADRIWKKYYTAIISLEQIEYMLNKMYSLESIKQQMQDGQSFTLVYENEKPVGYIALSSKDNRNYYLHKFYVDTEKHRKGIGEELFKYMITELHNPESIELTVNRQNFKAINFYFKMGFVIERVADFDIGNNYFMNDFVMIYKPKQT